MTSPWILSICLRCKLPVQWVCRLVFAVYNWWQFRAAVACAKIGWSRSHMDSLTTKKFDTIWRLHAWEGRLSSYKYTELFFHSAATKLRGNSIWLHRSTWNGKKLCYNDDTRGRRQYMFLEMKGWAQVRKQAWRMFQSSRMWLPEAYNAEYWRRESKRSTTVHITLACRVRHS